MKIILSILFVFIFAFAAFGQSSCPVTLSTYTADASSSGNLISGTGTEIEVFAAADCVWTATANAGWVYFDANALKKTASGVGNGKITLYFTSNMTDPRTGTISVNDKTITLSQGSTCFYHFPYGYDTQRFPAEGGTHTYTNVSGYFSGVCTITYTTGSAWIHPGASDFAVDRNEGAARTGYINYLYGSNNNPTKLTVQQAAGTPAPTPTPSPTPTPTCTFQLGTNSQTFTYTGGSGLIDVITQNGCAYTATNNDSFVTLSKSNGTGNGTINFDVGANGSGATRTTTITIQGQIFTVNQSGAAKTRKRIRMF